MVKSKTEMVNLALFSVPLHSRRTAKKSRKNIDIYEAKIAAVRSVSSFSENLL
jgi:hypothetical protein